MFQKSRHLFTRHNEDAPQKNAASRQQSEAGTVSDARHPAMQGLNVSPVHGRHCICDRCAADAHAA